MGIQQMTYLHRIRIKSIYIIIIVIFIAAIYLIKKGPFNHALWLESLHLYGCSAHLTEKTMDDIDSGKPIFLTPFVYTIMNDHLADLYGNKLGDCDKALYVMNYPAASYGVSNGTGAIADLTPMQA